ncbi:MAG: hypothetical protein H0T78_10805 [Longispora sp.]|nr:hypothetical protein [Longispora sp. (in: high G+C Gram-positive bacteria)]
MSTAVSDMSPVSTEIRLRDGLGYASKVFVAVWFCWALLGLLGVLLIPAGGALGVPGLPAEPLTHGWHNFFLAGNRGDALWYQRIGDSGYGVDDGSAAFFPLYPFAIHILSSLPGISPLMAANVIAQGSYFGALIVLYALTMREFSDSGEQKGARGLQGKEVAQRATRYLAVFPTAFFFLAPLTEGPFLLLSLLTFWYVRRGQWWQAAVFAGLATLTRSVGLMLVAALVAEALIQRRSSIWQLPARLAACTAPVVGLVLYGLYWANLNGNPFQPLDAQANWQREETWPPVTVWNALEHAWRFQSYWLVDLLVVAIVVVAIGAGVRILPLSYLFYSVASVLLPLVEPFPARPLLSMPRFVAVIFPAFWVIAVYVERRRLPDPLVMGVFSGGFVLLGILYMNHHAIF